MSGIRFVAQRPGEGTAILNAFRDLIRDSKFDRATGMFAFASHKGVQLLIESLKDQKHWLAARKRWVISIDGGITEPDAMRTLIRMKKSEVFVPDAEDLLTRKLQPKHRFHPKTLLLEQIGTSVAASGILVGSANLTCNGLCFGHENCLTLRPTARNATLTAELGTSVETVEATVGDATKIDLGFVDRYEAIRPKKPIIHEPFEDERTDLLLQDKPVIPVTQAAALAAADNFWIDIEYVVANRGKHEEGNQIDMQRGTRVFFGFGDRTMPRNSPIGTVTIRFEAHSARRNIRFGNNQMDKLDLPIPVTEGPSTYSGQTLLFTRETPTKFRLTVGTRDQIREWKRKSKEANTFFAMRSGREFGVF